MSDKELKLEINKILNRLKVDAFYGAPSVTLESQDQAEDELVELFKSKRDPTHG